MLQVLECKVVVECEIRVGDSGVTRRGPSVAVPALAAIKTKSCEHVEDKMIVMDGILECV